MKFKKIYIDFHFLNFLMKSNEVHITIPILHCFGTGACEPTVGEIPLVKICRKIKFLLEMFWRLARVILDANFKISGKFSIKNEREVD